MKKQVIISCDMNPDYMYYIPLTVWAWAEFGWETILMNVRHENDVYHDLIALIEQHTSVDFDYFRVNPIDGYRNATVAQISRLYPAYDLDGFIMTADADMIPLSDYWHPKENEKTVYGFDLTGNTEFPICYLAMTAKDWRDVMKLDTGGVEVLIKRDLDSLSNAKSDDFYKWWGVDQQLITKRLSKHNPTKINRGQYKNGFAVGRVDRGAWTLDHKQFIDAHLHHQIYHKGREEKFNQTLDLLYKVWPDEDFGWFVEYHHKFKKLTGHA